MLLWIDFFLCVGLCVFGFLSCWSLLVEFLFLISPSLASRGLRDVHSTRTLSFPLLSLSRRTVSLSRCMSTTVVCPQLFIQLVRWGFPLFHSSVFHWKLNYLFVPSCFLLAFSFCSLLCVLISSLNSMFACVSCLFSVFRGSGVVACVVEVCCAVVCRTCVSR